MESNAVERAAEYLKDRGWVIESMDIPARYFAAPSRKMRPVIYKSNELVEIARSLGWSPQEEASGDVPRETQVRQDGE